MDEDEDIEFEVEWVVCSCGLAMYAIESAGGVLTYFCEDCDPHLMELFEDAS